MSFGDGLQASITAAVGFLKSRRSADGMWRDFHTLAGASSDWVSGFVCCAVIRSGQLDEDLLGTQRALTFRQRPNGGWSYNRTVPTDCDSTAWVLLAFSRGPVWRPSVVHRAVRYVKRHQHEASGGFLTYSVHDRIDRYIGVPSPAVTRGWLGVHPSVTGTVIQGLLVHGEPVQSQCVQAAVRYLLETRETSGLWRSYWWQGYAYGTYQALRSLMLTRALDTSEVMRSVRCILDQQQEDGGWNDCSGERSEVFATSFNVLSLLLCPDKESRKGAQKGISWLQQQQEADGDWPVAPILRIPPPMVRSPESVEGWRTNEEGTGVILEDPNGIFTAAAALWALSVFRAVVS